MLGSLAAVPLGLALSGPLAQATSPGAVLTGAAILATVGTAAVLLVRQVRELEQPNAAPMAPTAAVSLSR